MELDELESRLDHATRVIAGVKVLLVQEAFDKGCSGSEAGDLAKIVSAVAGSLEALQKQAAAGGDAASLAVAGEWLRLWREAFADAEAPPP